MILSFAIVGFTVGVLIGLTGMGGGLVMTPLLVFFFGIHPTVAVGTDLLYAGITKLFGFWQHWRQKTIHMPTVKWMAVGSVPGAILGVLIIKWMLISSPQHTEDILGKFLGITFLIVSIIMIFRMLKHLGYFPNKEGNMTRNTTLGRGKLLSLGILGGSLVGLTSVGSGSIFIALLSTMGSFTPAVLVGTDIAHAAILTLVAGAAHALIGTVHVKMIAYLLLGSIPGIILGSRLALSIPEKWVQSGLILLLFLSGVKLL